MKIRIDGRLRKLIPPLNEEEQDLLEAMVLRDGIIDPLRVWKGKGVLLDGHHRLEIARKHDLDYDYVEIECENREEAEDWIDTNQLGRRNLSKNTARLLRGRRYNRLKKRHGNRGPGKKSPQSEDSSPSKTSERLGQEYGVSHATIERDGYFAKSVDKLIEANADPELEAKIHAGEIDVPTVSRAASEIREDGTGVRAAQRILRDGPPAKPKPIPDLVNVTTSMFNLIGGIKKGAGIERIAKRMPFERLELVIDQFERAIKEFQIFLSTLKRAKKVRSK